MMAALSGISQREVAEINEEGSGVNRARSRQDLLIWVGVKKGNRRMKQVRAAAIWEIVASVSRVEMAANKRHN